LSARQPIEDSWSLMTTIQNFEELKSWKKARELAGCIYELTRHENFLVTMDCGIRFNEQRVQ
jgi:hypothetical protein